MRNSKTALGAFYRQISRRLGGDVAVFATARKLATIIYRLLRWGQPYVGQGAAHYENQYQQRRLSNLKTAAQNLGYELIPKIAKPDYQKTPALKTHALQNVSQTCIPPVSGGGHTGAEGGVPVDWAWPMSRGSRHFCHGLPGLRQIQGTT